jgi:hypothetical protein
MPQPEQGDGSAGLAAALGCQFVMRPHQGLFPGEYFLPGALPFLLGDDLALDLADLPHSLGHWCILCPDE